jgi:hypothetical protein
MLAAGGGWRLAVLAAGRLAGCLVARRSSLVAALRASRLQLVVPPDPASPGAPAALPDISNSNSRAALTTQPAGAGEPGGGPGKKT